MKEEPDSPPSFIQHPASLPFCRSHFFVRVSQESYCDTRNKRGHHQKTKHIACAYAGLSKRRRAHHREEESAQRWQGLGEGPRHAMWQGTAPPPWASAVLCTAVSLAILSAFRRKGSGCSFNS